MTELYRGPTTDFIQQATQNQIAATLSDAFFDHYGYEVPGSELRSWRNSLRALALAVDNGGLNDHGIFLEYQLPLSSKRIDAMITGHDDDGRASAVIVELKQWDDCEASPVPECVGVRYGGRLKDTLHPSAQAGQYREYLADTHTAFHDGRIRLHACSYLHDFQHDETSELLAPKHVDILGIYPLFAGDRVSDLVQWLTDKLGAGDGMSVLHQVTDGRYRPHKKLLEHTAAMIRNEPTYVLLDEQRVVFNSIVAKVSEVAELEQKAIFVVKGGPGTGKSVLALNLVAELAKEGRVVHHATGSSAFTNTVRKIVGGKASKLFNYFNSYLNAGENDIDVLICDEAHRIRKYSWSRFTKKDARDPDRPQIDELLAAARVGVFFLDDMQAVRKNEIGTSEDIERAAAARGAEVFEYELDVQFRCGGSDGFLRWVENTLHIKRTANALWSGDENFDFDIVDSPEELEAMIRSREEEGHSARLVAGYCWPWSNPRSDGTLEDDVKIDGWERPWNAKPDTGRLADGIPKSYLWASEDGGIDQVGCIYTAQGFEFDYVGVIFGNDLVYRPGQGWVARYEFSHDSGLKRGLKNDQERLAALIKNTYRVLLSRGLKGCYVYFLDQPTRTFVESRLDQFEFAPAVAAEDADDYNA